MIERERKKDIMLCCTNKKTKGESFRYLSVFFFHIKKRPSSLNLAKTCVSLSQVKFGVSILKSKTKTHTHRKMSENDAFCYPYHIEDDCVSLEKWSNGLQNSEMLQRNSVRKL